MTKDLLQQLLEVLEEGYKTHTPEFKRAIAALRQAIAQPVPPVEIQAAIEHERECCALICEKLSALNMGHIELDGAAEQIRARTNMQPLQPKETK